MHLRSVDSRHSQFTVTRTRVSVSALLISLRKTLHRSSLQQMLLLVDSTLLAYLMLSTLIFLRPTTTMCTALAVQAVQARAERLSPSSGNTHHHSFFKKG